MLEINKIYNEDCLEGMKRIDDKSVDMICCDLPYNKTACKWDKFIPFDKLWKQYNRIIKDNGAIVLFGIEPFSSYLRMSNIKYYRYDVIWKKQQATNPLIAKKQIMRIHENISIFYKKLPIYNPQMTYGHRQYSSFTDKNSKIGEIYGDYFSTHRDCKDGSRYPISVLEFNTERTKLHPTQKPVSLVEYLIKTYSNEGDLVLDNCMGSGTTAVACINTNRNFVGFETDEKYCNIANKRIEDVRNQQDI